MTFDKPAIQAICRHGHVAVIVALTLHILLTSLMFLALGRSQEGWTTTWANINQLWQAYVQLFSLQHEVGVDGVKYALDVTPTTMIESRKDRSNAGIGIDRACLRTMRMIT